MSKRFKKNMLFFGSAIVAGVGGGLMALGNMVAGIIIMIIAVIGALVLEKKGLI